MKLAMARALALALLAGLAGASAVGSQKGQAVSVAGVQKVINMLADMSAKVKKEKADEEIAFATFTTWCTTESKSLKSEIAKNTEEIQLLDSEIGKLKSDVAGLEKAIAKLKDNIETYTADKRSATAQREKDHAAYVEESTDYGESVDALDRAIAVLKDQNYDRTGAAAALLQVSDRERIPERARSVITAYLEMMHGDSDEQRPTAPEANAYEFQSGGIIAMLKRLQSEFTDKLSQCQKEEMNSKNAYNMVVMDLVDSIENSETDLAAKTAEMERKIERAADAKKQMDATIAMKADNEKTLAAMTTECKEKSLSFEEKQQLRTEEIEAIAKATEILQSPDVSGNAEKHLDLLQVKTATALLQLGDHSKAGAEQSRGFHRRVRQFIAHEGQRLRSKRLSLLAEKIAADPFAKVKQLIDSMITRLLEEARDDADHEGFCDTEIGKSKVTRNKLSEEIAALDAAIEDGKANIMTLTESTATLTKEVEELAKLMGEATEIRKQEKAKNTETIKDTKAAQTAVAAATAVLKDFYEKASQATGFLQVASAKGPWGRPKKIKMGGEAWTALANPAFEGTVDHGHKEGMQTFGDSYTGQQDSAGGVLAMLETIASDFANLEADTTAAETESQRTYDALMTESKKSKHMKEKKISLNEADKTTAESKLQQDIADLKSTQDELIAADRYYDKLVPQCIDQGQTFEERTKAREDEIASLKQALAILNSEDIGTSS